MKVLARLALLFLLLGGGADAACMCTIGVQLPKPYLGIYMFNDGTSPTIATIRANAPKFNVVIMAEAFGTDTSGNLSLDLTAYGGNGAALKSDVTLWQGDVDAKGNFKLACFFITDAFAGGGSANFLTAAQAANATTSLENIIDTYGFKCFEWDLESGESINGGAGGWNKTTVDQITANIKSHYGSNNIIIGQTPRPFELHAGSTKRGYMSSMDYSNIQYYFGLDFGADFSTANIQCLEGGTTCTGNGTVNYSEGLSQFVSGTDGGVTVPASKIVFGQAVTGTGQNGSTPAQYDTAWHNLNITFPGLRGAAVWQSKVEQGNGWTFSTTFGAEFGL